MKMIRILVGYGFSGRLIDTGCRALGASLFENRFEPTHRYLIKYNQMKHFWGLLMSVLIKKKMLLSEAAHSISQQEQKQQLNSILSSLLRRCSPYMYYMYAMALTRARRSQIPRLVRGGTKTKHDQPSLACFSNNKNKSPFLKTVKQIQESPRAINDIHKNHE